MQTQSKKNISYKASMINNLEDRENIQSISRKIYDKYCSLSGFLHVLPDFYLLGAQKSGTTALFDYLTKHPNIPKTIKDIRFYDKYFHKGVNWYKQHFPLKSSKSFATTFNRKTMLVGEATERYLEYPFAPKRIKSVTPNAKFLIILRNPIDRTYSHYNYNVIRNKENRTFEEAIFEEWKKTKNEFLKMQNDPHYYSDHYFRYAYLDRSIYVDKIKQWFSVFPKEQFFIIENNELARNTSKVFDNIIRFLNLSPWKLGEFKKILVSKYKQPKIDQNTKNKLYKFFKPHNDELYDLLNVKYDWEQKSDHQ